MDIKDRNKIELVAPAGSFSAAIYAFSRGADAVYAGLPSFSARKHARNLDLEQLHKLKKYAEEHKKKIYITLNTVIQEAELPELNGLLFDLAFLRVDGFIVQDPGLLDLLARYFPVLPVHASTQMAVHNSAGVRYLKQRGVKRVILARELSFEAIREIRESVPDVELEVFIHGALCYGFSGLCLASGMLLGRSGNRGDCAQICRSWFTCKNQRGYFFSCNDLALKEEIEQLKAIGVNALKIEGRMKSPEYTGLTAAYYRSILDGGAPGERASCLEQLQLSFSRNQTTAFFSGRTGCNLVNRSYPSHTGLFAGTVREAKGSGLLLQAALPLALHDGLLFFAGNNPPRPVHLGIHKITRNTKAVFQAEPGAEIWIESNHAFPVLPAPGTAVYKTSAHEIQWQEKKPAAFPGWKARTGGKIILTDQALSYSINPGDMFAFLPPGQESCICTVQVIPLPAQGKGNFKTILSRLLAESKDALFEINDPAFVNNSGFDMEKIFIRPSVLKQFKNSVYAQLQCCYTNERNALLDTIAADFPGKQDRDVQSNRNHDAAIQPRRSDFFYGSLKLPFADDPAALTPGALPLFRDNRVIALHPLIEHTDMYFTALAVFLEAHSGTHFLIGLNNIAHLQYVNVLRNRPGISFFIDYCLYCANRFAYNFYVRNIPGLAFIFYWIEDKENNLPALAAAAEAGGIPLVPVDKGFTPHLFLSKVCFRKHSLNEDCRGCTRHYEYRIDQNMKLYRVVVKDCLTYMFGQ